MLPAPSTLEEVFVRGAVKCEVVLDKSMDVVGCKWHGIMQHHQMNTSDMCFE